MVLKRHGLLLFLITDVNLITFPKLMHSNKSFFHSNLQLTINNEKHVELINIVFKMHSLAWFILFHD